jgi:hypothetical protein
MKLSELKIKTSSGQIFTIEDSLHVNGYTEDGTYLSEMASSVSIVEEEKPKSEVDNKLQSRLLDIIEIQARK